MKAPDSVLIVRHRWGLHASAPRIGSDRLRAAWNAVRERRGGSRLVAAWRALALPGRLECEVMPVGRPAGTKRTRGRPCRTGITVMKQTKTLLAVLTPSAMVRILLGWGAVLGCAIARPILTGHLPTPVLFVLLAALVAVIVVCSFGVVSEAEHLARRLGDPYGTLVLTMSIVLIEVILIAAVMLGPGEHATIARDSVMAATMIALNLVIGLALLVGGLRHGALRVNRAGASAYLGFLVVLVAVAFAFPAVVGEGGAYRPTQAVAILVLTVGAYAFFLWRQTGPQRGDFQEVPATEPSAQASQPAGSSFREHRAEIFARIVILLVTVTPIVLLSHDMAALLDDALGRAGAPRILSGVLIAMIVFLPEAITTVRAAWTNEGQRVSNLAHGALVSCVGLTLPVVLAIGLFTGQRVVLAEGPASLVLLGVTLALSLATFGAAKVTPIQGVAHLFVFVLFGISVFS